MSLTPQIAVIGSVNIDLTTFTDQFPRPGETIFAQRFQLGFGGKGANQAIAARRCGAEVSMIARVGDDLFGPASIDNFRAAGINTSRVLTTPGASSGVAPIFVDSSGQNRILVVKGANDRLSPADIEAASDVLLRASVVVLQLEIPLETVYFALRLARRHGIQTILNPAPAQPVSAKEIAQADYVIPNETEAAAMTGMPVTDIEEAKACAQALLGSGVQRVIITLGANGAIVAGTDSVRHIPPYRVNAFDTTGAGDAFIGSFAFFLASGHDEFEAIRRANLYAALSTLAAGTQSSFVTQERFESEWELRAAAAS